MPSFRFRFKFFSGLSSAVEQSSQHVRHLVVCAAYRHAQFALSRFLFRLCVYGGIPLDRRADFTDFHHFTFEAGSQPSEQRLRYIITLSIGNLRSVTPGMAQMTQARSMVSQLSSCIEAVQVVSSGRRPDRAVGRLGGKKEHRVVSSSFKCNLAIGDVPLRVLRTKSENHCDSLLVHHSPPY